MPLWLRRFTFNSIKEHYDKELEEQNKQLNRGQTVTSKTPIAKPPAVNPTYTSKASKK